MGQVVSAIAYCLHALMRSTNVYNFSLPSQGMPSYVKTHRLKTRHNHHQISKMTAIPPKPIRLWITRE